MTLARLVDPRDTRVSEQPRPEAAAPPVSVAVIIPVFDHAERLEACLSALGRQTYPREHFEVILVDNGAGPLLTTIAARHPRVHVLHEPSPGSYAARNRGAQASDAKVLAFTDADCVPTAEWLSQGVTSLLATPHVAFVAGSIEIAFADPLRPTAVELYESAVSFQQKDYVARWHFGATANLFTFRHVFEQVGPFDARLRSLGDREWGRRTAEAGLVPVYCEQASVFHPARRTLGDLVRRAARMTGGFYSLSKHGSWSTKRFLDDCRLGLFPLERLLSGKLDASGRHATPWRRLRVAGVVITILGTRVFELLRLLVGGHPRRA